LKFRVTICKRKIKKTKNRRKIRTKEINQLRKTKRRRTKNHEKVESLNQGRVIRVQVSQSHLLVKLKVREKEALRDKRTI
jgi:hypothetical protein